MRQVNKDFYKVATKAEQPWLDRDIAVVKRVGSFSYKPLDVYFDSVEDAEAYIDFIDLLEAV